MNTYKLIHTTKIVVSEKEGHVLLILSILPESKRADKPLQKQEALWVRSTLEDQVWALTMDA